VSGLTVLAPVAGQVVPLAEVPDPVFAAEMVGSGVAVDPATDPIAMLWSPPSTRGMRPSPRARSTSRRSCSHAAMMAFLYLSLPAPTFWVSGIWTSMSPKSVTLWPSDSSRDSSSAIRIAEGPMSTPRRPAPRSTGMPMISMFRFRGAIGGAV